MKRYFALLTVMAAVTVGTLTAVVPAQAAVSGFSSAPAVDAVVIANGVRLRSAPGGAYVIGFLYYGDYGRILSTYGSGSWCQFQLGGRSASGLPAGTTGWASCSYFAREDGGRVAEVAVDSLGS